MKKRNCKNVLKSRIDYRLYNDLPYSWIERINSDKPCLLHKVIYRFNSIYQISDHIIHINGKHNLKIYMKIQNRERNLKKRITLKILHLLTSNSSKYITHSKRKLLPHWYKRRYTASNVFFFGLSVQKSQHAYLLIIMKRALAKSCLNLLL